MAATITYPVRQGILRAMRDLAGAPVTSGELLSITEEPALRTFPDKELLAQAFSEMASLGYLEAVPGFGGRYFRISRRGLEQLLPEYPQDPYIWGPGAVR